MPTDPGARAAAVPVRAAGLRLDRRALLCGAASLCVAAAGPVRAAERLDFEQIYSGVSVLGLTISERTKALAGREVTMRGYMAPPLKAEATFFVLTSVPMALCPFCSSDADWPDNIVVVYLTSKQTFVQANALIEVTGLLELGSWTDPETGFVSLLRMRDSRFAAV
jgi:hypothetical protein